MFKDTTEIMHCRAKVSKEVVYEQILFSTWLLDYVQRGAIYLCREMNSTINKLSLILVKPSHK